MFALLFGTATAFAGEVEVAVDAADGTRLYFEQFLNVDEDDFPITRTLLGGERVKTEVTQIAGELYVCTTFSPSLTSPFTGPCSTATSNSLLHAQLLPGGELIGHYADSDNSSSGVSLPATISGSDMDPGTTSGSSSDTVACSGCCGSGDDQVCIDWTCPTGQNCDFYCDESGILGTCK